MNYGVIYKDKIKAGTFLFKKIVSDSKKEFNKIKEKGKGKVAKGFFVLTFNEVKNNKDSIKKNLILKEKRKGNNNLPKVYNLQKTYL